MLIPATSSPESSVSTLESTIVSVSVVCLYHRIHILLAIPRRDTSSHWIGSFKNSGQKKGMVHFTLVLSIALNLQHSCSASLPSPTLSVSASPSTLSLNPVPPPHSSVSSSSSPSASTLSLHPHSSVSSSSLLATPMRKSLISEDK